ncbi:nuclear transport factor 2 family protein [Streptomyces sp. NPDC000878]
MNSSLTQDVSNVLVRYATGIDRRDWALFRTCFTEDCDADYGDIGRWHGADAITAWMDEAHQRWGTTMHRITNQAVSGEGDRATARSYVDALLMSPDGRTGTRAVGYYDDNLVRTDESWKIARRQFVMVSFRPEPGLTDGAP